MYHQTWLNLINTRDSFYLILFLVMASALFWQRISGGRLYVLLLDAGLVTVLSALAWSTWQLLTVVGATWG